MVVDPPVAVTTELSRPLQTSWRKLCSSDHPTRQLSKSEQLLRERMRSTGSGLTQYDYLSSCDLLLVHGPQCLVLDRQSEVGVAKFPEFPWALDYKLCPLTPQLLGCVCRGEVWVIDSATGVKHQMTSLTTDQPIYS
ncbi:dipeptidyl peptidase 9-like [Halichondria panicea]|uniref:dipeptidyl peptidase 9-like n=1 Tax=Halichondria panicea TaxID=6063 RepID=UPI00312B2E3E